jgi:cytoskeleton protein RodZ
MFFTAFRSWPPKILLFGATIAPPFGIVWAGSLPMAKGNFGEHLKRERDMREVTLAELTAGTRIGPRFLEAIENEEWEKLPGGTFTRGFVRSIAQYLGLDEEDLLSEYDLARGVQKTDAPAPYQNQLPSPPRWIPALALLALVLLAYGFFRGGFYAWQHYRANHPAANSTLPPLSTDSAAPIKAPDKLELTVSTSVRSHVRILADDQTLLDADVMPGDIHHFNAAQQFQIIAADGAALHLEQKGRPITSRAALGNSSRRANTIVLGYKDLRPSHDGTARP